MAGRLDQAFNRAALLRKRRADQLAQLVADGVPVHAAGARLHLTKGQTARAWANIRAGIGRQAQ